MAIISTYVVYGDVYSKVTEDTQEMILDLQNDQANFCKIKRGEKVTFNSPDDQSITMIFDENGLKILGEYAPYWIYSVKQYDTVPQFWEETGWQEIKTEPIEENQIKDEDATENQQTTSTTLTIYTNKGHTYQFNNVSNISTMNETVEFTYVGKRSGKETKGYFTKIAGYTVS